MDCAVQIKALKGKHISKVAAGATHSLCVNLLGNAVFSWGRADYGQLGLTNAKQEPGNFVHTPQQVAFPESVGHIRINDIVAGSLQSFAILDNYDVYSWGFNVLGTTGHSSSIGDDILRPRKLNVLRKYKDQPKLQGAVAHVHNMSGGGQHALMVIKRYSKESEDEQE